MGETAIICTWEYYFAVKRNEFLIRMTTVHLNIQLTLNSACLNCIDRLHVDCFQLTRAVRLIHALPTHVIQGSPGGWKFNLVEGQF